MEILSESKRPVLLIGDGINQSNTVESFKKLLSIIQIPVISSRFSHDIVSSSPLYYGYIGSHGIRTANFILSKADLIISLGNRMHFPVQSESFKDIFFRAKLFRVDIDKSEFTRNIPNSRVCEIDLSDFFIEMNRLEHYSVSFNDWIHVCDEIKKEVWDIDNNLITSSISNILSHLKLQHTVVADVGNNEFWVSQSCVNSKVKNRVLYSKSFGALGCAIGKAIGAYYATKNKVICFVGDQGIQMNIQELQFISQHRLPIKIIILNNSSSGMIKDREELLYGRCLHTTYESGFSNPKYQDIAKAYDMEYFLYERLSDAELEDIIAKKDIPCIIELKYDKDVKLYPSLPKGNKCQELMPPLPINLHDYLNKL
jgi:acetolactate synthase-1/2/3 large subunit